MTRLRPAAIPALLLITLANAACTPAPATSGDAGTDSSSSGAPIGSVCSQGSACQSRNCSAQFAGGYCTATCATNSSCPSGSVCGLTPNGDSLCLASCSRSSDCRSGYACDPNKGACLPASSIAPCSVNNGSCDPNATCTASASGSTTCTCKPGFIGDGKTCSANPNCMNGAGSCSTSSDCCSGLTCQSGTCQQPPACGDSGEACCAGSMCNNGLTCQSGTCQQGNTNNGPIFLSFGTNVTTLQSGQSVTFVAVLTDSAGLSALAGGALQSPGGSIQYGAFTAANQGSYSLILPWSAINQSQPIDFMASGQRSFEAIFFDSQGKSSTRTTALTLSCSTSAPSIDACNGTCTNLMTDARNCGTCGTTCAAPLACVGGQCACPISGTTPCGNECRNLMTDANNCGTCGKSCANGTCSGGQCVCQSGMTLCGNGCVDATQGMCQPVCTGGPCVCPSGTTLCGAECVDLTQDKNNCGKCGAVCAGTLFCSSSVCTCASDVDCATGSGQGGPSFKCVSNGCNFGVCAAPCASSADCGQGDVCDTEQDFSFRGGNLVATLVKVCDSSCQQSSCVCSNGGASTCEANGVCVWTCVTNQDCINNQFGTTCTNGACQ